MQEVLETQLERNAVVLRVSSVVPQHKAPAARV
jgi:hypothetical protein